MSFAAHFEAYEWRVVFTSSDVADCVRHNCATALAVIHERGQGDFVRDFVRVAIWAYALSFARSVGGHKAKCNCDVCKQIWARACNDVEFRAAVVTTWELGDSESDSEVASNLNRRAQAVGQFAVEVIRERR